MSARLPTFRTPSKHPIVDGVMYIGKREICLVKTVAGKEEYKLRTEQMAIRQQWKCAICTRIMNPPTFDHAAGRGAGKQDDKIWDAEGHWLNAALCWTCQGVKGSTRYVWDECGFYVPFSF